MRSMQDSCKDASCEDTSCEDTSCEDTSCEEASFKDDFYREIVTYGETAVPMHMPGHKRNTALLGNDLPYAGDITEIDGFDNLHDIDLDGVLGRLSARAAALYSADYAFPLVNGSTGGLLAAVRTLTALSGCDRILMTRNCHKSLFNAAELCRLSVSYLLPERDRETGLYGSISPESVGQALDGSEGIGLVVLTSPTYEGVVSDIPRIAEIVHRHGAFLLVDAAHGAHCGFSEGFPPFPTEADLVVTSLHKTLPSLTQTALGLCYLHDRKGDRTHFAALPKRFQRELSVFETSSPSYPLMSSISRCLSLLEEKGSALFASYRDRLASFYRSSEGLRALAVLPADPGPGSSFFLRDSGKILIFSRVASVTGQQLASALRREAIEPEMAYDRYVLCMTSICDCQESFDRLLQALFEIVRELTAATPTALPTASQVALPPGAEPFLPSTALLSALPPVRMTAAEGIRSRNAFRVGAVSSVYAWAYPPGIPLIVPGEEVTEEVLRVIRALTDSGTPVRFVPEDFVGGAS